MINRRIIAYVIVRELFVLFCVYPPILFQQIGGVIVCELFMLFCAYPALLLVSELRKVHKTNEKKTSKK